MRLFKIIGNWMRGLWLIGLGGFWLGIAYYLSSVGNGFGGADMGQKPTIIGLGILGSLTMTAGLIIFIRGMLFAAQRAPLPKESAGWRDDGEPTPSENGFDADAAIARYLARRPEPTAPEAAENVESPQRPVFGRKQV